MIAIWPQEFFIGKRFEALLGVLCACWALAGCGSFVDIRDMSKISPSKLVTINELSVYEARDLRRGAYKTLGTLHGYSCTLNLWDPPATKVEALKQLKFKALEAGANAIVLDTCFGEGTTYSKNCWQAFTCSGEAAIVTSESFVASREALPPPPLITVDSLKLSFPRVDEAPHDVAVIIANAKYKTPGRTIPNISPAYADAAGFQKYAKEALGIREDNIIFLKDATKADFAATFGTESNPKGQLHDWIEPGKSNVFVYFVGHGAPGAKGKGSFLVPVDASPTRIELTSYPLKTMYENLGKLPAKSITLVLEACFSGLSQAGSVIPKASPVFIKSKLPDAPKNLTLISAGAQDQIASWEQDESHSLFSKFFLLGMSGKADEKPIGDGNGKVALAELRQYVNYNVSRMARRYYGREQTPQFVVGRD